MDAEQKNADLYEILGVERTATTAEIRAAYRAKAHDYHPDKVGKDGEQFFHSLVRARDVLTKPKSREIYDSIGKVEEDQADNEQAQLITALTGMFGVVMGSILKQGAHPAQGDFLAAMNAAIRENFDGNTKQIVQLQNSRAELVRMEGRFKVLSLEQPNHMETIVTGQLGLIDRQIEASKTQLRQLEAARKYLNDVKFEQEGK